MNILKTPNSEPLLNTKQVLDYLQIKRPTLDQFRKRGLLVAVKGPCDHLMRKPRLRFRIEDVQKLLQKNIQDE